MHYAMRREHDESAAIHIDESHHNQVVRRIWQLGVRRCVGSLRGGRCAARPCPTPFIPIGQGGFVAVMAVRNDELLVIHLAPKQRDQLGIGDSPHAVLYFVFILNLGVGRTGRGEQVVDLAAVVVQHEDLAEMGPGGA